KQFNNKELNQILTEFEKRVVHFIVDSGRPYIRLKKDFGKFASRIDFVTLNVSRLIIKGQEAGSYLLNRDDVLKLIHDVHVKYGEMATMVFGRDIAYLHSNVEKDERNFLAYFVGNSNVINDLILFIIKIFNYYYVL